MDKNNLNIPAIYQTEAYYRKVLIENTHKFATQDEVRIRKVLRTYKVVESERPGVWEKVCNHPEMKKYVDPT